jgi:threonyl-tRNA synthetase
MGKVDEPKIEVKRHSLSHILAMAVLDMFPEAKLAIGPDIENGFYYDFDLPRTLIPEDLPLLEEKMRAILKQDLKFERSEKKIDDALKFEKSRGQKYKEELVADLKKEGTKTVSYYQTGDFIDLCAGPHVNSTRELGKMGFKLDKVAGAYWRGSEKNKMLQRIYALAFETKPELAEYEKMMAEAEKRDHRKIGATMGLFSFHDEGPGFPFWHPKGMVLRNSLIDWWRAEHIAAGYEEINTPIMLREELWHQSGHWDNYKNNMYFTEIDEEKYAIKPMNCPGGILIYKTNLHSYRELPIRMGELGLVHRHELSGVLHGLFRVRAFTQDDAHIYCREDQIEKELEGVIKLVQKMYAKLGFKDYHVELSTRPPKSTGTEEMWNHAEKIMNKVAKDMNLKIKINPGDGAFYGPKFDFHIRDSIGRTWQCGTIQLDFSMPERFDLTYVDEKGERKRPVMIHRTILGSIERFMGVLLEHFAGALPVWLAPVQVRVMNVGPSAKKYAKDVQKTLEAEGVRAELDDANETVGKKIREAELQRIPYMLVIGDKEVAAKSVAVRKVNDRAITTVKLDKFVKDLLKEIESKSK